MFVLFALYPSPFHSRHHVTPGTDQHSLAVPKSITPMNPSLSLPITTGVNVPSPPHPTTPTVHTNTALQRETKPN